MPNATAHRVGAALVVGGVAAFHESQAGDATGKPLAAGLLAALCGTLPDILEPATHPNHRQFCHSWVFMALLGGGLHKLYQWQPDTPWQEVLRWVGLVGGGSYLVHLAMDSTTSKSLPLLGRI